MIFIHCKCVKGVLNKDISWILSFDFKTKLKSLCYPESSSVGNSSKEQTAAEF